MEVIRAVELSPEQRERLTKLLNDAEMHSNLAFKLKMEVHDLLLSVVAHDDLSSLCRVDTTAERTHALLIREERP